MSQIFVVIKVFALFFTLKIFKTAKYCIGHQRTFYVARNYGCIKVYIRMSFLSIFRFICRYLSSNLLIHHLDS